ncbi:acyltransferase family protein [Amycolatopsis granulosa]|uniref:acyltransferase family protein n=1 Tax=Amycolatopsis granulosa TaxID=185684 RepID=UPI00141FEDD9|nr:acyltransferase [Amycolatopsis granulosa]NIH85228.1 fucose 4-O-acetylase-like acetyltransferase [Amycolatopsis granulosa]
MRQSLRQAPAGARDTFLDVVRATAILAVIGQHWLMPVLSYDHGTLATGNALATPGWWALTWLSQVMPMVFFAGGAANLLSLRRAASTRDWLSTRLKRLLIPVLPLFAVWLLAPDLLRDLGAPEQPVQIAGAIAGQLLWFLAVYLITVAATPLMLAAHRRWGLGVPLALTGLAVIVDIGRFEVFGPLGYANAVFVWLAVHQLGFHYAEGRLATLSRRGAARLAVAGLGVTALAVAFGPYPGSMIGMPGAPVSNMSPPTAVLMSLAVGQIGFWLALKPTLTTLAERPAVAAVLRWSGPRFMSLYLWHMPALVVVAGVAVLGFGYATPEPGSTGWFAVAPMWVGAAAVVLAGLLKAFGRFETRPSPGSAVATGQLAAATALASGGLLGLAAHGFTPPAHGGSLAGPLPWVALVLAALLLVSKPVRVAVRG